MTHFCSCLITFVLELRRDESEKQHLDYDAIESTDPYSDYHTIDESKMIRNFNQNSVCLPSPSDDCWSGDALTTALPQRPSSPNLLESCYQEMEKKGLTFFNRSQNDEQSVTNRTRMAIQSGYQKFGSARATNKGSSPQSPPSPCRNFSQLRQHISEITSAEIHDYYLEPKSSTPNTFIERDLNPSGTSNEEHDDGEVMDDLRTNANGDYRGDDKKLSNTENSGSVTLQDVANGPSVGNVSASIGLQYEDALSVYDVYIL